MSYISCAELARRAGVSRPAVKKAIDNERISPEAVRRVGGRVLVDEAAGMAVLDKKGHYRPAAPAAAAPAQHADPEGDLLDLMAWGAIEEVASEEEDYSSAAGAELARLRQQLERTRAREQAWVAAYKSFREWFASWVPENFTRDLWQSMGVDSPGVVDVGVKAVELVLPKLRALDECDVQSRYPGANG